jgi:NADH-quinone oxidoreductase subunit G
MAAISIDNQPYEVPDGQNLLHTCLTLGFDLPYFCWHPALGSVGACRQCAVKQFRDENDTRGRLVMACMTPAANGTRISIDDPEAREFRASVIEGLMINHPHDCPVCDEGGECHLQDMTVMTGHDYRRYRGLKRTYRNQDLGPFVNHEMNRCIQCYRCVRFYRDHAGGRDLDSFGSRNHVYFGRHEDGVLESEFSGNLVEVCPTGVFTDKTLKQHYTRKWDLQTAPSICVNCGLGCNAIPGERYGELRRIHNRYNGEVNGYFLCDRGRYGYEFVNSGRRIRQCSVIGARCSAGEGPVLVPPSTEHRAPTAGLLPATREDALKHLAAVLAGAAGVIGIGSPRASLEANFALRTLVGPERFYLGMSDRDCLLLSAIVGILREGPARSPSLHDVEQADAVLVLGEDVTNTAPRLALALRQSVRRQPMKIAAKLRIPEWDDAAVREAVQQQKGPLFIAAPYGTRLDDAATQTFHAAPDDLARLGFAVAHALSDEAPPVPDRPAEVGSLAGTIAQALKVAERPLVVSGTGCQSEAILQAAANVAWALCRNGRAAELCFAVPECNSMGLAVMGGGSLGAAFKAVQEGAADTVLILENDLYRRADAAAVDSCLDAARHVIVIDHLAHATTRKAEVTLPAATFAEGDGTLVSSEGRGQRFYQVFVPDGEIQESWRWLRDVMTAAGRAEAGSWLNLDAIDGALAEALPFFKTILEIAPPEGFRVAGERIPREPHRYSGRTAMTANISVHEPRPPDDPDSPLAFSMEGYQGQPPPPLIPRFWAPGWNSVQSVNKFQSEVGGPLRGGDPGRRLLEPAPGECVGAPPGRLPANKAAYFRSVPAAFAARPDEWLIVPIYHIFGSEELSVLTPGVAERSPQPYLALNPEDASRLQVGEGDEVELGLAGDRRPGTSSVGAARRFPVRIVPTLPQGVAGLPAGLPGSAEIALPAWSRLRRLAEGRA